MIKVAILEDDEKVRGYLSALIDGSREFTVVREMGSAEEAMELFSEDPPAIEIFLTDLELPGKDGIDFIAWFKPRFPDIQVMVLSSYDDSDRVFRALRAGASGYVLKTTPAAKLLEALHDLHRGGSPMSSQIARMVVTAFQKDERNVAIESLSVREKDVLHWLAQGFRYQDIADKLFISVETVRTHIRNIYEKLHARNRAEALRNAGLV